MRKFQITSPVFSGEADIVYDEAGRLVQIDVMSSTMSVSQVASFKAKVPAHVDNLAEAFSDSRAIIVEKSMRIDFLKFWNDYGKKIKKARAEPLFNALSDVDTVKALLGIKPYDQYLAKEKWRPKVDPETYIRNRYWENEYK